MPISIHRYLTDKESNFISGILNFLVDFQDFPNKRSKHELKCRLSAEFFVLDKGHVLQSGILFCPFLHPNKKTVR